MKKLIINIETLILHICKMSEQEFVTCVNEYARGTRYVTDDTEVCKLKNDKVVNILDPEYFGIYSNKMRIDWLKKYYIKNIIENWSTMEKEDQQLLFLAFC